jgi:hypothetical protein
VLKIRKFKDLFRKKTILPNLFLLEHIKQKQNKESSKFVFPILEVAWKTIELTDEERLDKNNEIYSNFKI